MELHLKEMILSITGCINMTNRIKWLRKREQIIRDKSFIGLSKSFFDKARKNLITMNLLLELNKNKRVRKLLKIPKDYDSNEWAVISGYYAMYSSALALIAKIGFKSKTHTATLYLLHEFYVKKELLNKRDLELISHASLKKEELDQISEARHKREIAQYSVTKQTTKEIAEKIKKDAYSFVNKVDEILNPLFQ